MSKYVEWVLDNFAAILLMFLTGREVLVEGEITNAVLWYLILTVSTMIIKILRSIESKLDKEK